VDHDAPAVDRLLDPVIVDDVLDDAASHQLRMWKISGVPSPAQITNLDALPLGPSSPFTVPLPLNWALVPRWLTTSHPYVSEWKPKPATATWV
jgi:hypothetical protein